MGTGGVEEPRPCRTCFRPCGAQQLLPPCLTAVGGALVAAGVPLAWAASWGCRLQLRRCAPLPLPQQAKPRRRWSRCGASLRRCAPRCGAMRSGCCRRPRRRVAASRGARPRLPGMRSGAAAPTLHTPTTTPSARRAVRAARRMRTRWPPLMATPDIINPDYHNCERSGVLIQGIVARQSPLSPGRLHCDAQYTHRNLKKPHTRTYPHVSALAAERSLSGSPQHRTASLRRLCGKDPQDTD